MAAASVVMRARIVAQAREEAKRRKLHWDTPTYARRTPEMQAIYDTCRYDLEAFAREFFPHLCRVEFSQMHHDMFESDREILQRAPRGTRGLREARAAPRGNAKTTILALIKSVHRIVYRLEYFTIVFSGRFELAEDRVKQIRDTLEYNTHLIEVFGVQKGTTWNNANFVTAPDTYSSARGVRVMAASPTTQTRGLLHDGHRPSRLLLDDFENPEHVTTQLQREKTERRFTEDISHLGDSETNIDVIGTLLHPDSLLARQLRNPGFRSKKYQAVLKFADASAIPLWQQWRDIFNNKDNPNNIADARAFFEAHEEDMLRGHEVLWPQWESYYDLMVMRLVDGETAFQIEKQNNPTRAEGKLFRMDLAGYFDLEPEALTRTDGRRVPFLDLLEVVAYLDPAIGQQESADWSACVVLAKDKQGYAYVLDVLMMHALAPSVQDERVADLLWKWRVRRFGCEANTFQTLALNNIKAAVARKAQDMGEYYAPIYVPVQSTRNKMIRISTLESPIINRHLWFARTLHPEFLRQLDVFRPIDGADKDDGPDALSGGMLVLHHREK